MTPPLRCADDPVRQSSGRECSLGHPHRLQELLDQNGTGMCVGMRFCGIIRCSSVIVRKFHVVRVVVFRAESQAPLNGYSS